MKCRAYRIFEEDGRSAGRLTEVAADELGSGGLLIRAAYSSVNYKDALAATGAGKVVRRFPLVGGIDVAGVVDESSDGRFREGDRVLVTGYGMSEDHDGGYSEWVRVPADWAVQIPPGLDEWEAMALGTAGLTAALAIHKLELNGLRPENGPVAVTGATGGVGSLATDMLAGLGYEVTAITGKRQEHGYLRRLGAASVLSRDSIRSEGRPLEKALWAGAVDSVGGEMLSWLTRTTMRHGSIAAFGNAGGAELHTTVMPFILRGVNLLGVNSGYFPTDLRRRLWERLAGDLRPRHLREITRTIDLDDLPDAFDRLLAGAVRGRIVVRIFSGQPIS
ncbi:MAG: oxidoreductase [Actinomycetota bacterium]